MNKCEGNCEENGGHRGEVVEVFVWGQGWPKTTFFYCQAAIEEDERRGFIVEIKELTNKTESP